MIKPWSVQLEVVEGCNFRCWFCGIHAIRGSTRQWNFMSIDDVVRPAMRELNTWLGHTRIELNNHGEPTLHPNFYRVVSTIREEFPKAQIQLQTNGYIFFPQLRYENNFSESVKLFFEHGGNLLALNCYKKGLYEFAMEHLKLMLAEKADFELIDFYFDNPENQSAYRYYSSKTRKVFVFQDLGLANEEKLSNKRMAKKILNEGGNSPEKALQNRLQIDPIEEPLEKACSRVFRELTIGWNGVVPACCYDWKNDLVFGKFPETPLRDIWESDYWKAARVLLHPSNKERCMSPCDVCDYNGGFRLGLLPAPDSDMTVDAACEKIGEAQDRFGTYRFIPASS